MRRSDVREGRVAEAIVVDVAIADDADAIAKRAKELSAIRPVQRAMVSLVVGTRAGPGAAGLVFYAER